MNYLVYKRFDAINDGATLTLAFVSDTGPTYQFDLIWRGSEVPNQIHYQIIIDNSLASNRK